MGISINGPSGIDTGWIIDSLVELEYQKVIRVQAKKDAFQARIDAYSKFMTFIKDIGSVASKMQNEEDFNLFTTTSSNEDIVSFTAGTGGVAGTYDIRVFQTAQREKVISADKLITSQTEKLSDLGVTPGKFSINGIEIEIGVNDTIQDIRNKINSATDATGKKPGVTATVLKLADDNFRLVLTAEDTGSAGAEYADLDGGTFLQDLGIILDAAGDKGIASQKLQSVDDLNSVFGGLAVGEQINYSGVDRDGNVVSNSFVVSAASTIDDLLAQVEKTFHGMVDVTLNGDGTISIDDKVSGQSNLAITTFTMGGTDYAFNINDVGYAGQNILTVGKNAYFSVDSLNMSSDKNSASGFISGVTLDFHKASYDEVVTVDMDRDYDGIAGKVEGLLSAYNALVRFVKSSSVYGDEEEGETKGALAGDMTARTILSQVRSVFQINFDIDDNSTYDTLSMIGIKTDINSGEFKLDKEDLKEVLQEQFDEVVNLFITRGYSDNPNIVLGTYSDDTADGVYSLTEVGDQYDIQRTLPPPAGAVYTSASRIGDIISFKDGPANGLSLTAPLGSGNATFTFSKGLSGHLEALIKKLTDAREGTIAMRQESWEKSQERCDDRIITLEIRIESYRMRLVKEFSHMEQVLNQLRGQSNNMMSMLGYYTQ